MEAIATRLEAIASRVEAFATRLEAIATRVVAIASRVEAIATRLEAIASRVEAIATRLKAIASRVEAIATRLEAVAIRVSHFPFLRFSVWAQDLHQAEHLGLKTDRQESPSRPWCQRCLQAVPFCISSSQKKDMGDIREMDPTFRTCASWKSSARSSRTSSKRRGIRLSFAP